MTSLAHRMCLVCIGIVLLTGCGEESKSCSRGSDDDSSTCREVVTDEQDGEDEEESEKEIDLEPDTESADTETETVEEDTEEEDTGVRPPLELPPAALRIVDSCEEAWKEVKQQVITSLDETLEREKEKVLSGEYCAVYWRGDMMLGGLVSSIEVDDADADEAGGGSEASEYSTTNNQVAGVDEADFVKNDGSHIYILSQGAFQIIKAWPAAAASRVSSITIEGDPKKLFVSGNRALVYSSLESLSTGQPVAYSWRNNQGECTHGYDCDFTGDGRRLKMTLLDISDKSSPTVLRETFFNASYLNARMVEDTVYTVVVFPELVYELMGVSFLPWELESTAPAYCLENTDYSTDEVEAMFERLKQRNRAFIEESDLKELLPNILDLRYETDGPVVDSALLSECKGFHVSQTGDGSSMISLLAFKIDELLPYDATTIVGRPGAVYASSDALYIAQRQYRSRVTSNWFFAANSGVDEASTIHKFALNHDAVTTQYLGSGFVKGRALNQFSMDEREGYLRIATTIGRSPSENAHSTVSVMEEQDGVLEVVGQVDEIAPTEDIRSVRFDGDRGFLVTFRRTDPLFVVDLSEPASPKVVGELKIPGFSTYMHMMDDEHILSIGFDTEDEEGFTQFQGIQLQVLDVSDVKNPSLLHKEVIGTRGSTSEATTNHLAFNFFNGKLAIPMVVCEASSGSGIYGDLMTFTGLFVYDVSVKNGFQKLGGIPHAEPETATSGYGSGCSYWWTNSNSLVQRSIFMDDYVYSIDMTLINISNIADLENPVSSVALTLP